MATNHPCAACKYLRRKCEANCDLAPYFPSQDSQRFAQVHTVFGKSNVSKLLSEIEVEQREEAVKSLVYEAEARLKDPVYGCVGLVSVLQLRLKEIQTHIDNTKKELANYLPPDVIQFALANPDAFFAQQNYQNFSPLGRQLVTHDTQQMPTVPPQLFIRDTDTQQMPNVHPQNFNSGGQLVNCDTQHTPTIPSHNNGGNLVFHDTQQTPTVPPHNHEGNFVIGDTQQQPTNPRKKMCRRDRATRLNLYLNDQFDFTRNDDYFD